MLMVSSWGHSCSVTWGWDLFALEIWRFWKSTGGVKVSSFLFSKSKIKSCWREMARNFLLCGKPYCRRPAEVQKWSLECLLRRLFQVLVLLTQNLLQSLSSCAGACMSLYCCQQCKSLPLSLPWCSVQMEKVYSLHGLRHFGVSWLFSWTILPEPNEGAWAWGKPGGLFSLGFHSYSLVFCNWKCFGDKNQWSEVIKMMFCGGWRHSWLECLPIIENMWLKMAIETLPGECRIYSRADQQHPGYEINRICGEPEEATPAAAEAVGLPAGCCACCAS